MHVWALTFLRYAGYGACGIIFLQNSVEMNMVKEIELVVSRIREQIRRNNFLYARREVI